MLDGLAVPVPTLFGAGGELDGPKNARFARALCDAHVDHVFVLGSLGEFPLVTDLERRALLEAVIESLTWHTDAWVGCGAPSTAQAVRFATEAEEVGAAVIVAVPPYYLHPTPEAVERYYRAIRSAVGIPLLAYNIPSLVGYALPPQLVHRLGADGTLAGLKDTSGSIESVHGFLNGRPDGFAVLPGNDPLALDSIRSGAVGAIMGTANVVPRLAVALVRAGRAGENDRAAELQGLVNELSGVLNAGPFPSTDKFLAARLRGSDVGYRSPYDPLTPEEERRVLEAWAAIADRFSTFLGP